MAVITRTYSSTTDVIPGATILAAHINTDLDKIYTEFNGNIDNNNVKAGAGIARSKLATTTKSIPLDLGAGLTVSGATGAGYGTTSGATQVPMLSFPEASGNTLGKTWTTVLPNDYVTNSDLTLKIYFISTSTSSGNFRWRCIYESFSPSTTDNLNGNPSGDESVDVADSATAYAILQASITLTGDGIGNAGDLLTLFITRMAAHANDTSAANAEVVGLELQYTANA